MRARGPLGGHPGRARSESGAVAVEFALVLPVLVMLMFGVFTSALVFSDHLALTNAVREGARLGAAISYDPADDSAWADAVQLRARQVYLNGLSDLATDSVCVELVDNEGGVLASPTTQDSSGCGAGPSDPSDMTAGSCVVKVWVRKPASISLLVFPELRFTISAQSVSHYGRTVGSCTVS